MTRANVRVVGMATREGHGIFCVGHHGRPWAVLYHRMRGWWLNNRMMMVVGYDDEDDDDDDDDGCVVLC